PVDLTKLLSIAEVWIVCPLLTAGMAFLFYRLFAFYLRKVKSPELWDKILRILLIFSAAYVAFSLGANDVGNAVGPISNLGRIPPIWLALLGSVALATGAITFGHRVTETVGGGITSLDPLSAFSAQLSAALAVHFFSILGVPVSTSQSVVGAVVGVGLVNGLSAIRGRQVIEIVAGWVATPLTGGVVSFLLYKLVTLVL
ncbi:MAG TPA: inorganic phosphate transporter, partial [Candidatus Acetothermia bacterium]|nr:inorganic phosphate transporter [Candidatus Acetothermia bacterium]